MKQTVKDKEKTVHLRADGNMSLHIEFAVSAARVGVLLVLRLHGSP